MKLLDPIGNVLGSVCLAIALVLSLPGIQVVRAGEPAAAPGTDASHDAIEVEVVPIAPAQSTAAAVCAASATEPAPRIARPAPARATRRGDTAAVDAIVLNTAGYNY